MQTNKLPIGYWIKQADIILTNGIDDILSTVETTRTDWQILQVINDKGLVEKTELTDVMTPFADQQSVELVLEAFTRRHLIAEQEGGLRLTENGKDLYAACLERQQAFRKVTMTGISEQDYQATVNTLQKMVANIATKTF